VIGYGNPLRGDDAVGQAVAAAVAGWGLPDVQALALHQLVPELAEPLAGAALAVFVDARLAPEGGSVQVQPVRSSSGPVGLGHTSDPLFLLGLARAVYGNSPPAWLITVPGADFEFGSGLSPTAREGMEAALRKIACLAGRP
jgi:hydrogenase maturation protease